MPEVEAPIGGLTAIQEILPPKQSSSSRSLLVRLKLLQVRLYRWLRGLSVRRDRVLLGRHVRLKLFLIGRNLLLVRGHIGAVAQHILRQSLLIRLKLLAIRFDLRLCGLSVSLNLIPPGLCILLKLSPVVGYFLLCGRFRGLYVRQKLRFVLIDLRLRGRSVGRNLIPPGLPISLKLGLIGRYLLLIRGHIGAMAQCILRQSLLVRLKLLYVRLYPRLRGLSVGRNLILLGLSVLLKLGLIVLHLLLGRGRFAGGLARSRP